MRKVGNTALTALELEENLSGQRGIEVSVQDGSPLTLAVTAVFI